MAKLSICAAFLLAAVGGSCTVDAWAADDMPTRAPSATTPSAVAPHTCNDPVDFFTTNCPLTWYGITLYGIVDTGVGWQSHGAPFDPKSAVGSSYLIQKQNRGSLWTLAPNELSGLGPAVTSRCGNVDLGDRVVHSCDAILFATHDLGGRQRRVVAAIRRQLDRLLAMRGGAGFGDLATLDKVVTAAALSLELGFEIALEFFSARSALAKNGIYGLLRKSV
jgi:hypothetical protein